MMFFYFLKIIFDISTSKRSKKYKSHSILAKKNSKFDETQLQTQYQTLPKDKRKSTLGFLNFNFPLHSIPFIFFIFYFSLKLYIFYTLVLKS
jgi:hypothetical protein